MVLIDDGWRESGPHMTGHSKSRNHLSLIILVVHQPAILHGLDEIRTINGGICFLVPIQQSSWTCGDTCSKHPNTKDRIQTLIETNGSRFVQMEAKER